VCVCVCLPRLHTGTTDRFELLAPPAAERRELELEETFYRYQVTSHMQVTPATEAPYRVSSQMHSVRGITNMKERLCLCYLRCFQQQIMMKVFVLHLICGKLCGDARLLILCFLSLKFRI